MCINKNIVYSTLKLSISITSGLALVLLPFAAGASAGKPKPGQTSTTCYYNFGPKLGQTESLDGRIKPVLIGKACNDGEGNSGMAVMDREDAEAEEKEESAKAKLLAEKKQQTSGTLTTTCQFNQGPKSGQIENYRGRLQPMPVGAACSDGLLSIGVTIAE